MHDIKAPMKSLLTCSTLRLATCWKIERTDAVVLRFTDHDREIVFQGETYKTGGFSTSARQRIEGTTPMNLETRAAIASPDITEDDLYTGKYRQAKVTEFTTDWLYPFGKFKSSVYYVEKVTFDGEVWQASLSGHLIRLRQVVGSLLHKLCRFELGDSDCTKDLGPLTESDAVDSVEIERVMFTAASRTEAPEWFEDGFLTWTTGDNAGTSSQVKFFEDGQFELYVETPFDIQVGDQFDVIAGCKKRFAEDCVGKHANGVNNGGYPFIPGNDDLLTTPDAR